MAKLWLGTRKGLFEVERGARGWSVGRVAFLGEPVSYVLADRRDRAVYAALNLGHFGVKLHRSDDGGTTWQEVGVPAYPPQPEASRTLQKPDGSIGDVPWKLVQIWTMASGGADEPGVLWAGTLPGGLFKSSDRGASWQLVESLWNHPTRTHWMGGGYDVPGIHSLIVDPRDSKHLTLGISTAGVWDSRDGGASWRSIGRGFRAMYVPPELVDDPIAQDIHCLASCAASPDNLWVQHHNGIFRSTDAGATWTEITGVPLSTFGFPTVVHPHDPATAWFVPGIADMQRVPVGGALAVTRTRDGRRTFEVLKNGLPGEHCYDLVYRHGLAIDDDGATLAMGSTTGGLWVSEDGGGNWSTVSTHLPMIHAVRFG